MTSTQADTTVPPILDTDALIDSVSVIKTLKVVDLKKQLGMRKWSKTGNKNVLLERLLQTIEISVSTATANGEPGISPSETTCTYLKGNTVWNNKVVT